MPISEAPRQRSNVISLADRLAAARMRHFAGRTREQNLWSTALSTDGEAFSLLWLTGPGGVGKTTLLSRLEEMSTRHGRAVVRLDARHLLGSTTEFLSAFVRHPAVHSTLPANMRLAFNSANYAWDLDLSDLRDVLQDIPGVLMIDTSEDLGLLEHWLRETFLPALPSTWLIALCGRIPPDTAWQEDHGWREVLRLETLENLSQEDASAFLSVRGIDEVHHQALISATHGHPLALSLAADVVLQERLSDPRQVLQDPDVVTSLLRRFRHNAPDSEHQMALQVAAHVRIATESTLRHALGCEDASKLYDWLVALSFSIVGTDGLYLHDLAAEVLDNELRRRDPERYHDMHRHLRKFCLSNLQRAVGAEQYAAAADLHWMHRYSPTLSALSEWSSARMLDPTPLRTTDHHAVIAATQRAQGPLAGSAIAFWLVQKPEAFSLVRDRSGRARGYVCALKLSQAELLSDEIASADPRVPQLQTYLQTTAPLRDGESVSLFMWQDYETAKETGQLLASVSITFTRTFLFVPGIAWTFALGPEPASVWDAVLRYAEHGPGPRLRLGPHAYWSYGHDWRAMPKEAYFELMGEREILGIDYQPLPIADPPLVLSRDDFAEAVRDALRAYTDDDALRKHPLSRCRVVRDAGWASDEPRLRSVLGRAVAQLDQSEKNEHLHHTVRLTYCDPGRTQQQTAELLGVPFSSYRRHLGAGIDRLTAWLWEREVNGYPPE